MKETGQPHIEGHFAKYLTSIPLTCRGRQNRESLGNCYNVNEAEEAIMTKCIMMF